MRIISRKALVDHWRVHPAAEGPLCRWYKVIAESTFTKFADIRQAFNSADRVGKFTVFNANSHRIVTAIHYNREMVFVRHVFTHEQYEAWTEGLRTRR